jgi:hypothetical protein
VLMQIGTEKNSRLTPGFNGLKLLKNNMKKIKTKDIDPTKLITKSEYAKLIKSNPVQVQRLIDRGEVTIVVAKGTELIHL